MIPDLDPAYRTKCIGCGSALSHDGVFWQNGNGIARYMCHASSHSQHSPNLSGREKCRLCGGGEGTIGYRFLVPLMGDEWRHLREEFCKRPNHQEARR